MSGEDAAVKDSLLHAATRLFFERGFDGVSVRDIAHEAGVTHGSIRYHFKTKEKLYVATLKRMAETAGEETDGDPGDDEPAGRVPAASPRRLPSSAEGERHLLAAVKRLVAFQARLGGDRHAAEGLFRAEVTRDGGPHPAFFRHVIKPGHERFKQIVRSIRPDITDEKTLEILTFNVIFQCVMVRIGQGTIRKLLGTKRLTRADVELIGDLIAAVTLEGLRNFDAPSRDC